MQGATCVPTKLSTYVPTKPLSFGLACMQERAALLGGKLKLRSARGKGAAVILELPPTYVKVPGNVKNQNSTH